METEEKLKEGVEVVPEKDLPEGWKSAKINSGPNSKKEVKPNVEEKFKKVEIIAKKIWRNMETSNEGTKMSAENKLEKDTDMETEEKLKEGAELGTEKDSLVVGTEDMPCSISKNLPEGWTIGNGKGAV